MGKRTVAVTLLAILILLSHFLAAAGPLPDTGQSKCFDNTTEITCPNPGEAFYGQDTHYNINPPSYTKLDASGNDLPDGATSWVMVRDNVTGLIWEVKTDDGSIHDKDNTYTWCDTNPETNGGSEGTCGDGTDTEDFVNTLNTQNFGGFSDWRIPTIKELSFIATKGTIFPAVNTDYFPNTALSYYWSSTPNMQYTNTVLAVQFSEGLAYYRSNSSTSYVRAVRGGQPESLVPLVINGDGTVTDSSTGLMWEQKTDDEGTNDKDNTYTWEQALAWINSLNDTNYLGYNDWRLPNINELQSVVDYSRYDPTIDMNYFPNTVLTGYWSSTTAAGYYTEPNASWVTAFTDGHVSPQYFKSWSYPVRATRGGQNILAGHLVITNPKQGSVWPFGSLMNITWETRSLPGNVKISLSREGGKTGTFETLADSTENDGSFQWLVTDPPSVNCVLKIEPIDDPAKGTTQGLFTIPFDADSDGIPDNWERLHFGDISRDAGEDEDGDKFTNGREYQDQTDPNDPLSHLILPAVFGRVPDTGQTKCYDNSVEITCPNSGESFYGQDANYTINPPSYIKMDAQGNYLSDSAAEWAMVRDNVTGLIWEVKTGEGSIHDKDNTYTWCDTNPDTNGGDAGTCGEGTDTEDFINALNAQNFGGHSDWRLPTIKELSSILNRGAYNPAINTNYFPNTASSTYWSSTTHYPYAYYAWLVDFNHGYFVAMYNKADTYYVRAVRGGQSGSLDHLIINGDGTVTDTSAGLMWEQKANDGSANDKNNTYTWEQSLAWIKNLNDTNYLGYDDWRLPNINELQSLVDYSKFHPSIDLNYFPSTVLLSYYGSSTTSAYGTNEAWQMDFNSGSLYFNVKSISYYVRTVRGGQNWLLDHLIISVPEQANRWQIGSEKVILWNPAGIAGNVRISLSRQGGKTGTFEIVADNVPNNGSYTWTVTGPESFNCALKIEPIDEPDKSTTQSLFSICTLKNAWIEAERIVGPDKYRLTLNRLYSDGVIPIEAEWSVSDPAIATISGNTLTAVQNGWVEVSTTYEGQTYTKGVFVYNTFEAMEVESNNTKETPNVSNFPMADGIFYRGSFPAGDVDYFKFTLVSDSILDLGYLSYSTSADMNIQIFDASDTPMASAISINGRSEVLSLGLPGGTYYLKLTSAGDIDQSNYYIVTYKILNSLPAKSTIPLNIGDTGQGVIYHFQDKADFNFTLAEKKAIKLQFTPESGSAGYLIEILDTTQTVIDQIECVEQIPVTIETVFDAGSYTVRVTPIDVVDASQPFALELTESTNQVEAEPNDTYQQATAFNIDQSIFGRLSDSSDADFFEFTISTPKFLELAFTCPNSSKNFYLTLYKDSDQNLIDGINSINGENISLHMGLGIGKYYLKVTSDGSDADTVNPYSLSIIDSIQTNLEIESNNTIKFANAIEKDSPRNGRIFSSGDIDYYGFHLSELGLFNIAFATTSTTGDYKVSLVDENDEVIDFRTSVDGAACSMDVYQSPGNFYIKVENNGDIDQHSQYELTLTSGVGIEGIKKIVSVTIAGAASDMIVSDTQTLSATAGYSDATTEAITSPIWTSLDAAIATVNSAGLVTAIAEGTTTIVASHGGVTGEFNIKVGSPPQVVSQHYGNLIIMTGSGASESDPLTESAQYLSDLVYKRFQNRLFKDGDIYYFNPVSWHDIDGDGYDNNVVDDDSPTINEFGQAITGWAAEQSTDGPLYIYMVGHGLIDTFSFPTETLNADQLNGFIETFQADTGRQVIVIIEACKSGSFTDNLVTQGEDLIVVTSTDDQDAYLKMGGRISFSQFFLDRLHGGDSIYQSWLSAKDKLSNIESPFNLMHPQLAEGITMASNQTWLGGDFVVANLFPGWVLGKVYDASTGISIETANIDIGGVANVNTIDGGYYLCQLPSGTYTITVTAAGYEPISLTDIGVGLGESIINSFAMTASQRVSTPTFLPPAGSYTGAQQIELSCATDGAIIRYTTDGGNPIETSPEYVSPIEITAATVIKARAFKTGWAQSEIATGQYVIYSDSDGDGIRDDLDGCPNDPGKTAPGFCGCGTADTDTDSDGTPDCNDTCPNDPNKTAPGVCGCGINDVDSDGDKILDCMDAFPNDLIKNGDINNDLNIDLSDAILSLQVLTGIEPTSPVFKQADVNRDSRIGLEEVIYILQSVSIGRNECNDNSYCGQEFYCAKKTGECNSQGQCVEKPEACTTEYFPVCGCDGVTYPNACAAAEGGVSVAYSGPCI